jgi:hypothetical protein
MSADLAIAPGTTEQLATAERMLAEVKTAEDAQNVMAAADFAADLARRVELGTASVNHALTIKAKAMRKLADVVDEGQAKGEIRTAGQPSIVRAPDNTSPVVAPAPLPLPRQRLAECRQIRDAFTEDELEQHFAEATEHDKELPTRALVKLAKQTRPPVAAPPPRLALAGTFATFVADPRHLPVLSLPSRLGSLGEPGVTGYRSKHFRYDCETGCYIRQLPDWDDLLDCFPRSIRPTDIDGMVEINGNVLFLEEKGSGIYLPEGQRRALLSLSRRPAVQVLFFRPLNQLAEGMEYLALAEGRGTKWQRSSRDGIREWLSAWVAFAEANPYITERAA